MADKIAMPKLAKGEVWICGMVQPERRVLHSILLTQSRDDFDFDAALAWSRSQLPDGQSDAPSRIEALMLFLHQRALFKTSDVLWTNEQCAGSSVYAWVQHFSHGDQGYWLKDHRYRARAVRSEPI